MTVILCKRDYGRMEAGETIQYIVEAKDRKPVKILASINNKPDDSVDYENAVFNGECEGC